MRLWVTGCAEDGEDEVDEGEEDECDGDAEGERDDHDQRHVVRTVPVPDVRHRVRVPAARRVTRQNIALVRR